MTNKFFPFLTGFQMLLNVAHSLNIRLLVTFPGLSYANSRKTNKSQSVKRKIYDRNYI